MKCICDFKTGIRHKIPHDEVVEYACPSCFYVWLEYSSSESTPEYCPNCGVELVPDEEFETEYMRKQC